MSLKSIRLLCSLKARSLDDFISGCNSIRESISYSLYVRYRQDVYWLYDLGYIDDVKYNDYISSLDSLYIGSGRCDD